MFRRIVLLVGGLALLSPALVPAQDAILGQKYGNGVHAYFSGDYPKAYEQLTVAIQGGSSDPRVFYFRGLAYLQLGRQQEAAQDFLKGAELESRDVNKFYNVSKALERVQGSDRVALETYRAQARMAVFEEVERLRKARYEAIQREESRVLRQEPAEIIKTPEPAGAPAAEAAAEAAPADPFAGTEEKPALKAIKKPSKVGKKMAVDDATEGAAEKKPLAADADPFAIPAMKPAEKASAAKAATEKKEAAAPANEDPFAAEPAKPVEKAKEPAAKAAPAAVKEVPAAAKVVPAPAKEAPAAAKIPPAPAKEAPAAAKIPPAPAKEAPAKEKKPEVKKPATKKADSDDPFAS
jgi:hypothetical protein